MLQFNEKDFIGKDSLNFGEAKRLIAGKVKGKYFIKARNISPDGKSIFAEMYIYRNNKPFKTVPIIINLALFLTLVEFEKKYVGKKIYADNLFKSAKVYQEPKMPFPEIITFVDDVFNRQEWQKHLRFEQAEREFLEPDNS